MLNQNGLCVNFSKFIIKIKMKIGHFLDNFSKVKSVFKIRIDVPNQDTMFQIRLGCSKCKFKVKRM